MGRYAIVLDMTSLEGASRGVLEEVKSCGFFGIGGAGFRDMDDEAESLLLWGFSTPSVLLHSL